MLTVAVEIGYTQIRAVLLDTHPDGGQISPRTLLPILQKSEGERHMFNELSIQELVNAVAALAAKVAGDRHKDVKGVGVACAAAVSPNGTLRHTGVAANGPSDFEAVENEYEFLRPVRARLQRTFANLNEVVVANRTAMAAWGEYQYGWGRKGVNGPVDNLVYLHVGGGVSAGIITQGSLYLGEFGYAGDFGHILVHPESTVVCELCHRAGCLSSLVGGGAILNQLEARREEPAAQELIHYLASNPTPATQEAGYVQNIGGAAVDARGVAEVARQGGARNQASRLAQEIMIGFKKPLGRAVGQIACLLDPSDVVLGGIIASSTFLEAPVAEVAREYIPSFRRQQIRMNFSYFWDMSLDEEAFTLSADEAPLYGVANWVWDAGRLAER